MLPDPSAPRAESLAGLNLVYGVSLALCVACLACCACFPAEPSRPPSRSARSEADAAALASLRTAVAGFKSLACNRWWGVVAAAYAVSVGFLSAWGGVLVLNLSLAGIPQNGAGYIGFASTIVGFAAGLVVGRIADASRCLRPLTPLPHGRQRCCPRRLLHHSAAARGGTPGAADGVPRADLGGCARVWRRV